MVLSLMVIAFGFFITFQLWQSSIEHTLQQRQSEFDLRFREATAKIYDKVVAYEQVLRASQGLFYADEQVTREEFHLFNERLKLDTFFPGVQGVGYVPIVQAEQLAQHINQIRIQGFNEYTIRPATPRPIYSTILYIEPFTGKNLRAFGYDMYSEPTRREAMERARDTGDTALSGKVLLVQDNPDEALSGVLMYLPLYQQHHANMTIAERRQFIYAWVYAVFRPNDLLMDISQDYADIMQLAVYDGSQPASDLQLFGATPAGPSKFQSSLTIKTSGRSWLITGHSAPSFEQNLDTSKARVIGLSGIAVTLLFALLSGLLINSRERALKLADAMTRNLRESEERFRSAFETSAIGMALVAIDGGWIKVNQSLCDMLGYSEEELLASSFQAVTFPDDLDKDLLYVQQLLAGDINHYQMEKRYLKKSGGIAHALLSVSVVRDAEGRVIHFVSQIEDITARKHEQEQIKHYAFYDVLTNLPNRRLFEERLGQTLARARRYQLKFAVIYVDVDYFKDINDAAGHDVGDEVLKQTAERLLAGLRASDTLSRFGGDEFVVLLNEVSCASDAEQVAENLQRSVDEPFLIQQQPYKISLSIGIAVYDPAINDTETELMKKADIALYEVKASGRNNIRVYGQDHKQVALQ